jgi:hypothetical protein
MKGRETNEMGGEGKAGEGRGNKGGEAQGRDWPAHLFEPSAAYGINLRNCLISG